MDEHGDVASQLLAVATGFAGDSGLEATLRRLCEVAVGLLPTVLFAGITMIQHGRPETAAFTHPSSPEIDAAQYESGSGPCLDAFRNGVPYVVPDTKNEPRWPEFAAAAAAHGIRSTLSIPLKVGENSLGALNLYSGESGALSDSERDVSDLFAVQASAVLTNAQAYWSAHALSMQLQQAMESRKTIDQAIGILMVQQNCGSHEALERLRRTSQDQNRKVRDLALDLVAQANAAQAPRSFEREHF